MPLDGQFSKWCCHQAIATWPPGLSKIWSDSWKSSARQHCSNNHTGAENNSPEVNNPCQNSDPVMSVETANRREADFPQFALGEHNHTLFTTPCVPTFVQRIWIKMGGCLIVSLRRALNFLAMTLQVKFFFMEMRDLDLNGRRTHCHSQKNVPLQCRLQ